VLAFKITFGNQLTEIEITLTILAQQHHAIRQALLIFLTHPQINTDDGFDARIQRRTGEFHHGEQITLISERGRRHVIASERGHQRFNAHHAIDQRVLSVYAQVDKTGSFTAN